ncbi:hypothetical protein [Arsenophonus endosymbiont of Aleurodicus floccissimus]|uniref:hypothetical protein n=1 Tax=Arsenophonus endosymbiont of Aleurodicus floccissimus TaxID=2152761 RepID=UPI0016026AB2|nr:hypothetical protein [Arsenophonus endosymbiont of Aleurodicus floccissimus]
MPSNSFCNNHGDNLIRFLNPLRSFMTSWRKFETPIKLLQQKQTRVASAIVQIKGEIANQQQRQRQSYFLFIN